MEPSTTHNQPRNYPPPLDTPHRGTPLGINHLADPLAESIHKDTNGPDKASDGVQYFARLPGRYLALADVNASTFRLGHRLRALVTKVDTCAVRQI